MSSFLLESKQFPNRSLTIIVIHDDKGTATEQAINAFEEPCGRESAIET